MALTRKDQRLPRAGQLVALLVDDPGTMELVRRLEPRVLARVIQAIGLEDAGAIVALTEGTQLERMFDDDLWHSDRIGVDASFDPERFALWLEIMLEAGEQWVADRLVELSEDLVTLGLMRQILVIDLDQLARQKPMEPEEVDLTDKALESCLCEEFDQHLVIARRQEGWDAVLSVLLALDRDHQHYLQRLLERCCHLSTEYIEDNGGLCDVLSGDEMLEEDLAGARDERRTRDGYVAPSSATAFLALARQLPPEEVILSSAPDPITHAYFRDLQPHNRSALFRGESEAQRDGDGAGTPPSTAGDSAGAAAGRLEKLLLNHGFLDEDRRPSLSLPAGVTGGPKSTLFQQTIAQLAASSPAQHLRHHEQLAYLANLLVEGCTMVGRRMRPVEAAEAALAVCNLGLEWALEHQACKDALQGLLRFRADQLFRVGWKLLFEQVAMATLQRLERFVARLRGAEAQVRNDRLDEVARRLLAAHRSGTPWTARPHLAPLGVLLEDGPTLAALDALLDHLPVLAGSLLPADAAARGHAFVSTSTEIAIAQDFFDGIRMSP